MWLKQRSYEPELLDNPDIPEQAIFENMDELSGINKYLGGHQINIQAIKNLRPKHSPSSKPLFICEIGCGGGDNLNALQTWATKQNIPVKLMGIDFNPHCIQYARKHAASEIMFELSDYRNFNFTEKPDILFSSLFCHHFTNEELVDQLRWMKTHSTAGFFINDLHRHWLAYKSIKIISRLFSFGKLAKNDAPLSVKRSFTKKDWMLLLKKTDNLSAKIQWKWAFRWLITYKKVSTSKP